MSRKEFMDKLEQLLQPASPEERQEAIQYYEDYFADAGVENEAKVIEELGSPDKVAALIQRDLAAGVNVRENGEFTERGYEDTLEKKPPYEVQRAETGMNDNFIEGEYREADIKGSADKNTASYQANQQRSFNQQDFQKEDSRQRNQRNTPPPVDQKSGINAFLLVILIVFAIPIGLPLLIAGFAVVLSLGITVFALIIAFGAAGGACLLAGILCVGIGIANMVVLQGLSALAIGGGLVVCGIGLLFILATIFVSKLLPAMFRGFVAVCRIPFNRRRVAG